MEIETEKLEKTPDTLAGPKPFALRMAAFVFCFLIIIAVAIGYALDLPIALMDRAHILERLRESVEATRNSGGYGVLIIVLLYAAGVIVAAPSALMTYATTLVFGLWAIPIAFLGAMIGLMAAFLVARLALHQQISWYCQRYPLLRGIENTLHKSGFWIIFLLRQSPIVPFAAQNYMFGVLRVPISTYFTASALGIIPGTLAKVYIFDTANQLAADPSSSTTTYILAAIGIAATIFVMWIIGKGVFKELKAVNAID
ncbi:MAG: VTT domain-containing protein [Pseudomonadota bacterium]